MFDGLQNKLQDVFRRLRGEGKVSREVLDRALREIRLALLEADVNIRVVKSFIARIHESAEGEKVLESLTPAQQVIKIVRDELVALLGEAGDERRLRPHHHEADRFLLAERRDRCVVGHVEDDARRHRRDAGIPRRTIELVEKGTLRELPGERMLASAAADQKHIHRPRDPTCSGLVRRVRGLYALCDRPRAALSTTGRAREKR